jgi:hypothetical protein
MSWWVCFIGDVIFKREGWLYFDKGSRRSIFGSVFYYDGYGYTIRSNKGLCVSAKISFNNNLFLFKLRVYVGIVQAYLVIGLTFQCVVFLMFGRLCHMCVVSQAYLERILGFVYFFLWFGYFLYIVIYISCLSDVFEWTLVAF